MPLPATIANNLIALGALAPLGPPPGAPAGGAAAAVAGAHALAFNMQTQQQSNWCWSAVSVSVAVFYNAATPWSQQCVLAGQQLGQACCPAGTNVGVCDIPWYLDQALAQVGHLNTWIAGSQAIGAIQIEINANRPLGVRIGWNSGGGHFVAISGYSSAPAGDTVTVEDPIFGQSTLPLAAFQMNYQSTGTWTHTYWTH